MNHALTRRRALTAIATTTLAAATLAGCSSAEDDANVIDIVDPWVKTADEGMTAAFGELTNNTDETAVLVSVSTDASPMIELHETVESDGVATMQEKDGGFTIEPGDTLTLEPGGDHIMLMGLSEPIAPGDEVDFTLEFADGTTVDFTAVAKEFAGANEEYTGDMDHGGMEGSDPEHSMSGDDHHDH